MSIENHFKKALASINQAFDKDTKIYYSLLVDADEFTIAELANDLDIDGQELSDAVYEAISEVESNIMDAFEKYGYFGDEGHNSKDELIGPVFEFDKDKKFHKYVLNALEGYEEPLSTSSGTFWDFFRERDIFNHKIPNSVVEAIDITLSFEEIK